MIKKTATLIILIAFTIGSFAYSPMRKGMNLGNNHVRNFMKTMFFFNTLKNSREKLNLTEKQNIELDNILRDVDSFNKKLKKEWKSDNLLERFLDNSYDPFKIEQENKRKVEQAKNFYFSKIKTVHDLLTKEQREIFVDIMKKKIKNMKRINKMRKIKKWKEKRMGTPKTVAKNY